MGDALSRLLNVAPEELVATRHRAVHTFLTSRGLGAAALAELMRERVGAGELLLTSSPVQGLANATSDLDFIRIQQDSIDGPRISTKIFEQGHHLEVVSFSATELERNLDELAVLASRPPAAVVAGFRGWDKRFEPRRKQTERIVNGITLDGTAPYLEHLPALALVWSRAALQNAVEQTVHLCLAEAAGELRGRVGYAYNVLLHLMDAVLSLHGEVYTTRKWYLLRWTRFTPGDGWHDDAYRSAARTLERLRIGLRAAVAAGAELRLAEDYVALTTEVAAVTGAAGRITVQPQLPVDAHVHSFLPGAGVLVCGDTALPVPDGTVLPTGEISLTDLTTIDQATASILLRALRAGIATVAVAYHEGDNR
ncbi:DUF6001 family protein [Nocardia sp. NPDC051570]|uniref:DUF6001 family protein n=1 Tax=Nocardia sp. NPDC051570 TaxID=3364324 RepID=UPI0037A7C8AB